MVMDSPDQLAIGDPSTVEQVTFELEEAPSTPARARELYAAAALVALADLTIYRGQGFGGLAALFSLAPLLLWWGAPGRSRAAGWKWVGPLLGLLSLGLVWCGNDWQVAIGGVLLVACSMALCGWNLQAANAVPFVLVGLLSGAAAVTVYVRSLPAVAGFSPRTGWLPILLPTAALLGFGSLFVLANPDEARAVGESLKSAWGEIAKLVSGPGELVFLCVAAWIAGGLLRPMLSQSWFDETQESAVAEVPSGEPLSLPLYWALRNMLVAVGVLFAAYLMFEFATLWGREFPEGFYYSGYAHEGAAWLTAALALSTSLLSLIFRGRVLRDSRLGRLKRLAWLWSVENFVLAVAAYHRLHIYIGFNGMTRMRVVGILGMTAVVSGFALVIWKIKHCRGFLWLINGQLWTLGAAVYLYAVLPVDWLVHSYNVRRILAGDPAPAVQISVHPIDTAGLLALPPLLRSENETIREGVAALLAEWELRDRQAASVAGAGHWTRFQGSERLLRRELDRSPAEWSAFRDAARRNDALLQFRVYAHQWY